MARWQPAAAVGQKEAVGRRLFDLPDPASGSLSDISSRVKVTHFEETRGNELSVDRLGRTNPEAAVLKYCASLAQASGSSAATPKRFDGWAVVQVQKLVAPQKNGAVFSVQADPIVDHPALQDNVYHAHVTIVPVTHSYTAALLAHNLFTEKGQFQEP